MAPGELSKTGAQKWSRRGKLDHRSDSLQGLPMIAMKNVQDQQQLL